MLRIISFWTVNNTRRVCPSLIPARCHMWVEFVVGFHLLRRFLYGYSSLPPSWTGLQVSFQGRVSITTSQFSLIPAKRYKVSINLSGHVADLVGFWPETPCLSGTLPEKPTFPNPNSVRIEDPNEIKLRLMWLPLQIHKNINNASLHWSFYLEFLPLVLGKSLCHKGMDGSEGHPPPPRLILHGHGTQTLKLLIWCTGSACHHQYLEAVLFWPVCLFQIEQPEDKDIYFWNSSSSIPSYSFTGPTKHRSRKENHNFIKTEGCFKFTKCDYEHNIGKLWN